MVNLHFQVLWCLVDVEVEAGSFLLMVVPFALVGWWRM